MTIKEITNIVEQLAPLPYQESYDNAGLIIGDPNTQCTGILFCLDATPPIVAEAIEKGCNMIIAHHPIIFSGLKKITGKNYVEQTVIQAIQNKIAIYAAHTNLDNVKHGVNQKIAEKLGLVNCQILQPKPHLLKQLTLFCPLPAAAAIQDSLQNANLPLQCQPLASFSTLGAAIWQNEPAQNAVPAMQIDAVFELAQEPAVHQFLQQLAAAHPLLQYRIQTISNLHPEVGSGIVGELPKPLKTEQFLTLLKDTMRAGCVRYTQPTKEKVKRIAVCGGAGSFLLPAAQAAQADVFVTADYKYHEFFDANQRLVIADIGHYESEQFTVEIFYEHLSKKITNFALLLASTNTNPIKYI